MEMSISDIFGVIDDIGVDEYIGLENIRDIDKENWISIINTEADGNDVLKFSWIYNEENNFLPPDNYQESRNVKIVDRTSSTNIGLELLAIISAYDLGFINFKKVIDYLNKVLVTIAGLVKWNGHLYNWYNTKTLKPYQGIIYKIK